MRVLRSILCAAGVVGRVDTLTRPCLPRDFVVSRVDERIAMAGAEPNHSSRTEIRIAARVCQRFGLRVDGMRDDG